MVFSGMVIWFWQGADKTLPIRGDQIPVGLVPEPNVTISARYYGSPGKVENRGVILLHTLNSSQDAWNDFAAELQDSNFEVMTLDFRGHGASTGNWQRFDEADFRQLVNDAAEAVEYLRDINTDMNIAVVGAGIGANVAVQLADRDPAIAAVALLSPNYEYKGIKITAATAQYTRPVYYIVSQDDSESYTATTELYATAPSTAKQLQVYETGGRGTKLLRHQPELSQLLIHWLGTTL